MRPEQADLLVKAQQSLEAARVMEERGYHDFAASRAYYTMFYLAEALLLGLGLTFSKHSAVIAAFGERFAKPGIVPSELHRYLTDGQDTRNAADYSFGAALTEADAREQITNPESFLAITTKLLETVSGTEPAKG
jgi:uncharacterized protein (UPF0332 family)